GRRPGARGEGRVIPAPAVVQDLANDVAAYMRAHDIPAPTVPILVQQDLEVVDDDGGLTPAAAAYDYATPAILPPAVELVVDSSWWRYQLGYDLVEVLAHE